MMRIVSAFVCMVACTVMAGEAAARGGSGGHSFGSGHSSSTHTPHSSSHGDHSVSGYTRKDGTYVAPHHQTNPNGTKLDNYSTKGNVNPYTGKPGTVDPYK